MFSFSNAFCLKDMSKQELIRNRVYNFYILHNNMPKIFTVKHFALENIARSTVYDIIKRAECDSGPNRSIGSGRKPIKMSNKKVTMLSKLVNNRRGVSQRRLAKKFHCSQSLISKTLKAKTSITFNKRKKIPARTEEQKAVIKSRCDYLYRKFNKKDWIIDDESYFTLSNSTNNKNSGFYTNDISQTPNDVKYYKKGKYEAKLMVWIAISCKGLTRPYMAPSGMAIDSQTYINKCLRPKLFPFIREKHNSLNYMFWPDLASSHYSKLTVDFMNANNIDFVEKVRNPPATPEVRAIEDFWKILKDNVYDNGWVAKNVPQLRRKIIYCINKFDIECVQRLAGSTNKRLNDIRLNNIIENR